MIITVTSTNNTPTLNGSATLTATPDAATNPSYAWSVLRGTGTFGAATSASTSYTPTALGKHYLQCVVTANEGTATGYISLDIKATDATTSGSFSATVTDSLGASINANLNQSVTRGGTVKRQQRSLYGSRISFGDSVTNSVPLLEPTAIGQAITVAVRAYMLRDCLLTCIRFFKAPSSTGTHTVVVWQLGNTTPLVSQDIVLSADDGSWVDVELNQPVALTASTTVPYLIGYFTPTGDVMKSEWVYGSQDVVEYPFHILSNGGNYGNVEGTGWSYGSSPTYPGAWQGHSYYIDPVVEWDADDAVYSGGTEYYRRFSSFAPVVSGGRFPIAIWQPLPNSMAGFKSVGMNIAATLGGGNLQASMAAAKSANMFVMPQFNFTGGMSSVARMKADPDFDALICGYVLMDEPDMVSPWVSPTDLRSQYVEARKREPGKVFWVNLGKWSMMNRGFSALPNGAGMVSWNEYWREYAHISDIASCDFYMEDSANWGNSYGLWCNQRMIRRLHDLCDNSRPVWQYIATTATPGNEPTPSMVYSSVWMSLIAGARGLGFFDHQFTSSGTWVTDFAMNNYPAMKNMMTSLLSLIQSLAGPLLAAEATDVPVTVSSSNTTASIVGATYGVPIHYTVRKDGGYTYLFTQSIRPGTTTGSFTVPAAANKTITVINESRTLSANGSGAFSDSYSSDYQVHLYRWQ